MSDNNSHIFDWAAVGTAVATLAGWLPPVAALLSVIWLLVQLHDRCKYGPRR